ncbi:MAG: phospho-sugar mutase [Desulfobacteraceae bacterium]|nr:phospho-sugar mutase [Desulfobacteraceae bacterium]
MSSIETLFNEAKDGINTLKIDSKYKTAALDGIETWLMDPDFHEYVPQIRHLIENRQWNFLLDAFYQVIPFGTGGRRGLVGIGPNRINIWTIRASAQGHAQYLIKQYGEDAKKRGVVLTFDVRKFTEKEPYSAKLPNPVMDLDCKTLATAAAEVYAANDIKVFMFEDVRSTPELSFAIRYLKTAAGDMFSASHNLPTDNGKKVYDEFGGQLIPPHDQALVKEVTENVDGVKREDYDAAVKRGMIRIVGKEVDDAYYDQVCALSMSRERGIRVLYSPLHGTGLTTVLPVLKRLGFDVELDPKTANMSGAFENVTFNIPNPEVVESFSCSYASADRINADIILSTDPDADRIGIMVRHKDKWEFLNGNEIGSLLVNYGIEKYRDLGKLNTDCTVIKTDVTSSLIETIARKNKVQCIGDLLVGFKYIGEKMNQLETAGQMPHFIMGTEESHGYIMGNYCRDKDAASAAVWLAEYAAELKIQNETLVDALHRIYADYGYCHNYLTEIRLLGAEGIEQIGSIMDHFRETDINAFGQFTVRQRIDRWDGEPQPHLSPTDTSSRNVLVYKFNDQPDTAGIRVTVRPSGTEPKIKMYVEVLGKPCDENHLDDAIAKVIAVRKKLEIEFMQYCYRFLGVDFPARGFLLFWQLPLKSKMRYFEIEPEIAALKSMTDATGKKEALSGLLSFLGANPIEKVDSAFAEKYGAGIRKYLGL